MSRPIEPCSQRRSAGRLAFFAGGWVALVLASSSGRADVRPANRPANGPPIADVHDVYAWMSPDGARVNLVMTLAPADNGTAAFGPGVTYALHVTSKPGTGSAAVGFDDGIETRVLCSFDRPTAAHCWIVGPAGTKDYLSGDPSNPAGTTSGSGKVRLFAGRRADPRSFNLQGLRTAATTLRGQVSGANPANCPTLTTQTAQTIRTALSSPQPVAAAPCPANQVDCYAAHNVMALVLQIDKSLLNAQGNTVLSVWGATHGVP